jgi:hypothetical protein
MAHLLPRRSRFSSYVIALALCCAIAAPEALAGCSITRTASNEITLRFGSECTSDAALQGRVKTDLLGAVSEQPLTGATAGGDTEASRRPTGAQKRRSPTSISSFTPTQKRLYALDQVRFERDLWWRRTFTPFAYYGQSPK